MLIHATSFQSRMLLVLIFSIAIDITHVAAKLSSNLSTDKLPAVVVFHVNIQAQHLPSKLGFSLCPKDAEYNPLNSWMVDSCTYPYTQLFVHPGIHLHQGMKSQMHPSPQSSS